MVHPSDFDLDTGRLCVMASRHKAGLLILTPPDTAHLLQPDRRVEASPPDATLQALGAWLDGRPED